MKKRSFLGFSLKQLWEYFGDSVRERNLAKLNAGMERKSKVVRVLASMFSKNYKLFLLSPVLSHGPLASTRTFLDLLEGLSDLVTPVRLPPRISKKEARFVYYSVFKA